MTKLLMLTATALGIWGFQPDPASAQLRIQVARDYPSGRTYNRTPYYGRNDYNPYGLPSPYGRYGDNPYSYDRYGYDRGSYRVDLRYLPDPYGADRYGAYRLPLDEPGLGDGNIYGSPYPYPYRHAAGPLRIVPLLPDVSGPDDGREEITLFNDSPEALDLRGWFLQDRHVNRFYLRGTIGPRQAATIRTDGSMPLNNGGDTVMVVDPSGRVVHSVTYSGRQVHVDRPITVR